jgi:iron complex transport system substrate-binding protein
MKGVSSIGRKKDLRICSLLPSATEIVCELGGIANLIGVTHKCDFPVGVERIRKVTRSRIPEHLSSSEIDSAVRASLQDGGTLYELDMHALEELQPDLVITQRLCDVCAVAFDRVQQAVASLKSRPRVLNLEPNSVEDIFECVRSVAKVMDRRAEGEKVISCLRNRVYAIRSRTEKLANRPRVFCMEWVNPPFCGGRWMKELVQFAGGRDDLANHRRPSYQIDWSRVIEFSPEIIVLTCCGFGLRRCAQEAAVLAKMDGALDLPAASTCCVYATDGSSYFSRPGPRIVESLEILAHMIHPELFPAPPLQDSLVAINLARAEEIPHLK